MLMQTFASIAQTHKPNLYEVQRQKDFDSLQKLLPGTPDDTLKVNRLLKLSQFQYDPANTKKEFSLLALAIAEKLHYKKGIVLAANEAGSVYQINKDYQTAINFYKKAISLSQAYGFTSEETDIYPALLNLYFYLGDYPNAMETISREMISAEKNQDKRRIAHCNNILGYIYFKQENFAAAEKYYGLYINNAIVLKDSAMLAHALGEVSDVYTAEKKYAVSINALLNTIRICDNLAANADKPDSHTNALLPHYRSKALYRLGVNYKLSGKLTEALQYALEAIQYANHVSPPKYEIARYYTNAGDVYKEQQNFKKAIDYLHFGFDLSREIQHRENIRDAAEYLSQTYASMQRYDSAFYFYHIYTGLKDSIVNNETKMKIAGIQGQYDIAKKDKEITRQQQIRNILIGGFAFLLIVLLLLYNSYRLKQKNKYQQQLNRQQNELFNAIVTTQDQERKRIAQDIHDSLGSVLSAAKLKLSSLEESKKILSPDQLEKYQTSLDLLDEASAELRNISHNIMPATLSKLGLEAALQNLIDKIAAHSKMQVNFTAHGFEGRIEEKTEMSIYRIILELINNIVKHAAAKKLTIQLIKYPSYINLMIEDDGKGFEYQKAFEEKKGIGLGNIASRVEYLNGTLEVDSVTGKGTTVIIEIPYTA
jgi:two-component system NarL family sensor kinase